MIKQEIEQLENLEKEDYIAFISLVRKSIPKLLKERAVLIEALELIKTKAGMTLLSDCCVDKNCRPAYDCNGTFVSSCQHQWGVARGYSECASEASDALDEVSK